MILSQKRLFWDYPTKNGAKTEQSVNTEAIQEELKSRITSYKIPKQSVQTDSLPRTHTGKILRDELPQLFDSG